MISEEDLIVLSSFLDSELEGEQLTRVRERLLSEPELRRELDALKASDARLREFSERIDRKPVPGEVHSLVAGSAGASALKLFAVAASVFVFTLGTFLMMPKQDLSFLDTLASGDQIESSEGVIEMIASFRQHDGIYCREFTTPTAHRVACRLKNGWQVMVDAEVVSNPAGTYMPAGPGETRKIDEYVKLTISGGTLDEAAEAQIIEQGWR